MYVLYYVFTFTHLVDAFSKVTYDSVYRSFIHFYLYVCSLILLFQIYFHISFICSCTTDKHHKLVTSGVSELGPRDSYNIAQQSMTKYLCCQEWNKGEKNEFCNDTPKQRTDQTYIFTVQHQNKKRTQRAFFLRYCVITITINNLIDFL